MILARETLADLQYFLMDAAKRYVIASGAGLGAAGDLLAGAAALDYVLLVSSEQGGEALDDAAAVAASVRETVTRAAATALDFIDLMLQARDDVFEDFVERHVRLGGIFDVIAELRLRDAISGPDVPFRVLTAASDILERRRAN